MFLGWNREHIQYLSTFVFIPSQLGQYFLTDSFTTLEIWEYSGIQYYNVLVRKYFRHIESTGPFYA